MAFDLAFSFKKHVSNICRSALYHIRDLRRIRIHLNKDTGIYLANVLVSSCLDYCNSLLFGCSEKNFFLTILAQLQWRIQGWYSTPLRKKSSPYPGVSL